MLHKSGFGKGERHQCRQLKYVGFNAWNQVFIKSMKKLEARSGGCNWIFAFKVTTLQRQFTGQEPAATLPHTQKIDRGT